MNLRSIIDWKLAEAYASSEGLIALCTDQQLGWKPPSGSNWMNYGQLLHHISTACGTGIKGFVTGDWGLPPGVDMADMSPEDMLPPAEKLPTVASVAEARNMLAADRQLAEQHLADLDDAVLMNRESIAPWCPEQVRSLGYQVLSMIDHLNLHKHQLFDYLKLCGQPVHTGHLWGMG